MTWTHDFLCLAHKDQLYPPNQREKLRLSDTGLGRKDIALRNGGDVNHVKEKLEQYFPKLKEGGGFDILVSQGRLEPYKTIVPPMSGYSVPFLKDLPSLGGALAYIRPIQSDFSLSVVLPADP